MKIDYTYDKTVTGLLARRNMKLIFNKAFDTFSSRRIYQLYCFRWLAWLTRTRISLSLLY